MKIQCKRSTLSSILEIANKATSKKNNEITECLLLEVKEQKVSITGTNTMMELKTSFPMMLGEDGQIIVNADMLTSYISKLKGEDVSLETIDNKLKIICGKAKTEIVSRIGAFPKFEFEDNSIKNSIVVNQKELKNAIEKTVYAAATDDIRPALTGILFDAQKETDSLSLVALDGYRIAIKAINAQVDNSEQIIVPSETARLLLKILKDEGNIVIEISSDKHIKFKMPDMEITSRLICENFINYSQIIPSENDMTNIIKIASSDITDVIDRVSVMTRGEKTNIVKFDINVKEKRINTQANSCSGISEEELPIEVVRADTNITIAFNAEYISDALKMTKKAVLFLTNNVGPVLCKEDGDPSYTQLILPIRLC